MKTITVYTNPELKINNGNYTVFTGKDLYATTMKDGSLEIHLWQTNTQAGNATFSAGTWVYVCACIDREEVPNE